MHICLHCAGRCRGGSGAAQESAAQEPAAQAEAQGKCINNKRSAHEKLPCASWAAA